MAQATRSRPIDAAHGEGKDLARLGMVGQSHLARVPGELQQELPVDIDLPVVVHTHIEPQGRPARRDAADRFRDDVARPKPGPGVLARPGEAGRDRLPARVVETDSLTARHIGLVELPLIERLRDDLRRRQEGKFVCKRIRFCVGDGEAGEQQSGQKERRRKEKRGAARSRLREE